jgi:uncharacterized protein YgiM (DUF1202 family)
MALTLIASVALISSVSAETLYVKKSGTKLQAEGSAKSKVVKVLGKGTAVDVKEKAGKFYKVSADGSEGFVFKFKLTSKKPAKAGGGLLDVLGGDPKLAAKESSSASSIRGLSPMSEDHAKKKGISEKDIAAVKQMENFKVSAQEIDQFLAQRKLGEFSE